MKTVYDKDKIALEKAVAAYNEFEAARCAACNEAEAARNKACAAYNEAEAAYDKVLAAFNKVKAKAGL